VSPELRSEDHSAVIQELLDRAVEPIAANPALRQRILELRATHDRVIDEVNPDTLIDAHGIVDPTRARSVIESWVTYLGEHRDEITAIQLLQEAGERRIAFTDVQQLADRISRPPHNWTPDLLWTAYETVHAGRVRHSDRHTLTDLVSLLRYTVGVDEELVPYAERVNERYAGWLAQQEQSGTNFSALERWWLDRMVEVIAASAGIRPQDLDQAPFTDRGGIDGALRDLGPGRAAALLAELNKELTA
jgi:type I restriction enzyme R subunit